MFDIIQFYKSNKISVSSYLTLLGSTQWLSLKKMELAIRFQILDKAVLLCTNVFGKGRNPFVLLPSSYV